MMMPPPRIFPKNQMRRAMLGDRIAVQASPCPAGYHATWSMQAGWYCVPNVPEQAHQHPVYRRYGAYGY
jgi:hypothetical protein